MYVYFMWLFLLSFVASPVFSSVAGIDFGSQFIKGSFIKPGKQFVIIENQQTKRKTEAAVTIDFDRRHFGPDAVQKLAKQPQQTLLYMQRLLGQSYDDEIWRKEFEEWRYNYKFTRNQRGTINVNLNDDEEYTVEEINAMILTYLNELLQNQAVEEIKDCVITIPAYYTYFQRKTIIDTLKLGSTSLEVALVNFTQVKKVGTSIPHGIVIGETWDFHIGANDVDLVIQNIIIDHIKLNSKKELPIKSLHRIKAIAEKAKKTLSANKEVLLNEVELYEGKNLKMTITRSLVEEKLTAQGWDQKLIQPIQKLLEQTKFTASKIDQIEMLGGGSRIPLVQQTIQNYFKRDLGWHINGEEDMANGIALLAANFSSTMSVRTPVLMTQKLYHKYKAVIYDKQGFQRETVIDKPFGIKKEVSLTVKNDFQVDLFENDMLYLRYKIAGTEKSLTTSQETLVNKTWGQKIENQIQIKVFITFKVSNYGWVEVEGARSQRYILYFELDTKNKTKEEKGKESDQQTPANLTDQEKTKLVLKNQTDKWELRVKNLDLVDENGEWIQLPRLMNFNEFTASEKKLKELNQRDKDWVKLVELKNNLETLIYQVKESINSEDFEQVTTEAQRSTLKQLLEETEDWLYTKGKRASLDTIKNQSKPIQDIVNPAQERIYEGKNRDKAVKQAKQQIKNLYNHLATLFVSMPWVEKQKQEESYSLVNKTEQWLEDAILKQKEKKAYEDPAFKINQIEQKMKRVDEFVKKIERIQKPSNKTKTEKPKVKDSYKPIRIGDKSYTMEEFEEYQKEQQKLREEEEENTKEGENKEKQREEEIKRQQFEEKEDL